MQRRIPRTTNRIVGHSTVGHSTVRHSLKGRATSSRPLPRVVLLLALFATLPVTLAGAGGSGPIDAPVSTIANGGGTQSALLPTGEMLIIDFSLGGFLTHVEGGGDGTGAGGITLGSGYQALREAVEENSGIPNTLLRRGDANTDGFFDISDVIISLSYLFAGEALTCLDAADSNDDGQIDISDGIAILDALFGEGAPPPAPGPNNCGVDPTADNLGCDQYSACP